MTAATGLRPGSPDAGRAPARPRAAYLLFAASLTAFLVARTFLWPERFGDLRIYRIEGSMILRGGDLYSLLPGTHSYATYPPFAGTIFTVWACVPLLIATCANFVLTVLCLVYVTRTSCRLAGVQPDRLVPVSMVFAAAFIWIEPVFMTFAYGQINLYLLALVLWDFDGRPGSRRHRGIGVGLAAAVKVTPAVFVVYLFLTRRTRAALTALTTFAAALALSLLINARATARYWTDYLFDTHRVGRLENAVNQTARGWLVRADHTRATRPTELILILLLAVVGMAVAVLAHRYLGERWGVTACALTGLMVSPISWSHHWVWCVPALVLLWFEGRRLFWVGAVIFWSAAVWWLPHKNSAELRFSPLQVAASGWYVVFGLLFLGGAAWRIWWARAVPGLPEAADGPPRTARR